MLPTPVCFGFLGGSDSKESTCSEGDLGSIPDLPALEEDMETHSSILAWRTPRREEPGGYSPWGHKESDTTERLSTHQHAPPRTAQPVALTLGQATSNPHFCRRHLNIHRQVCFSLLWGFPWVLMDTRFCSCLPRVFLSPSPVEVL